MYRIPTTNAISTAREALTAAAEWFALGARDGNGTSVTARREAALRVQCLEALSALQTLAQDDDGDVMPAGLARSLETPISEILGLASTPIEVLAASMPPIAGGAPFEPTAADWDDYAAWCDSADRERDVDAIHRDMFGF